MSAVIVFMGVPTAGTRASIFDSFKNPSGIYAASWLHRPTRWKRSEFDFRRDKTVVWTQTDWVENQSNGGRITIKQETTKASWRCSGGVVKVTVDMGGAFYDITLTFQGDDLIGDRRLEERRFKKE